MNNKMSDIDEVVSDASYETIEEYIDTVSGKSSNRDSTIFDAAKAESNLYYPSCAITGYDAHVCDNAHIIPYQLAKKLKYYDIAYCSSNLIRIMTGYHRGFEIAGGTVPYWSLRIDETRLNEPVIFATVEYYSYTNKKLPEESINGFYIKLRKDSEPFIRAHYHIFRYAWYNENNITILSPNPELNEKLWNIIKLWRENRTNKYKKYIKINKKNSVLTKIENQEKLKVKKITKPNNIRTRSRRIKYNAEKYLTENPELLQGITNETSKKSLDILSEFTNLIFDKE